MNFVQARESAMLYVMIIIAAFCIGVAVALVRLIFPALF